MEHKIEKNIPMPEAVGRGSRSKYPFSDMEVGDSVLFDGYRRCDTSCPPYNAASVYATRSGKKFTGAKQDGGVRIWRIA